MSCSNRDTSPWDLTIMTLVVANANYSNVFDHALEIGLENRRLHFSRCLLLHYRAHYSRNLITLSKNDEALLATLSLNIFNSPSQFYINSWNRFLPRNTEFFIKVMFSNKATKNWQNLQHWFDNYLVNFKLTVKNISIFVEL